MTDLNLIKKFYAQYLNKQTLKEVTLDFIQGKAKEVGHLDKTPEHLRKTYSQLFSEYNIPIPPEEDLNEFLKHNSISYKIEEKLKLLDQTKDIEKIQDIIEDVFSLINDQTPIIQSHTFKQIRIITGLTIKNLEAQFKEKYQLKSAETTKTLTTLTTLNTKYHLDVAGGVIDGVVIEPLGKGIYLYTSNFGQKKGLAQAKYNSNDKNQPTGQPFVEIEGEIYYFNQKDLADKLPFKIPSEKSINDYLSGKRKSISIKDIFRKLINFLKLIHDMVKSNDYTIEALAIFQTWLRTLLDSVFYIARTATMGGGKTSTGESSTSVCRHGMNGGDLSAAVLGRIVNDYQVSLHVDEIDQLVGDKKLQIEGILRKGQRRNNPYMRCDDRGKVHAFDTFNFHSYCFRSDTEDALKQRTYVTQLKPTKDFRLSILNSHKDLVAQQVFEDLFFWYMDNISMIKRDKANLIDDVEVKNFLTKLNENNITSDQQLNKLREDFWEILTKHLKKDEVDVLKKLAGRYSEIAYNILDLCKLLGLDLFKDIAPLIVEKQSTEQIPDSVYLDKLKHTLYNVWADVNQNDLKSKEDIASHTLQKGKYEGCFYFPKSEILGKFNQTLIGMGLKPVNATQFNGFLKDFGFVQNETVKNQRIKGIKDYKFGPVMCCIFSAEIMNQLKEPMNFDET